MMPPNNDYTCEIWTKSHDRSEWKYVETYPVVGPNIIWAFLEAKRTAKELHPRCFYLDIRNFRKL